MINISYDDRAWEEILWFGKNDQKLLAKIMELINSISSNPFSGIGKPEPLTGNLKGYWSRRITDEHRLIYKAENDKVVVLRVKGHYLDKG